MDNKEVKNAWCMPGGKMAVYSGILEIANNEGSLAALMGHEIAHAVARHGSERASQGLILDLGTMAVEKLLIGRPLTGDSRNFMIILLLLELCYHLVEVMKQRLIILGLVFMHFAGYDLDESYKMWERMDKLNSGNRTPEFLSTHPQVKLELKI